MFFSYILGGLLNTEFSKYFEILSALAALIGVLAIWYELNREKDLRESQFIIDLNNSFYENEDIKELYIRLNRMMIEVGEGKSVTEFDTTFSVEDELLVSQYLGFFGTINYLIERKMIDLKMIDTTFAYRYFLIANNPYIQDLFLIKDSQYYKGNYNLYKKWFNYRKKNGFHIIFEEHALNQRNPGFEVVASGYKFN